MPFGNPGGLEGISKICAGALLCLNLGASLGAAEIHDWKQGPGYRSAELSLPKSGQLKLAPTLLESAEASGDIGAEGAWEEEIERRIPMVDAGLARERPFVDVRRDYPTPA